MSTIVARPWRVPAEHAAAMNHATAGARHVTLHGCGHVPMTDDPEQVARVILDT